MDVTPILLEGLLLPEHVRSSPKCLATVGYIGGVKGPRGKDITNAHRRVKARISNLAIEMTVVKLHRDFADGPLLVMEGDDCPSAPSSCHSGPSKKKTYLCFCPWLYGLPGDMMMQMSLMGAKKWQHGMRIPNEVGAFRNFDYAEPPADGASLAHRHKLRRPARSTYVAAMTLRDSFSGRTTLKPQARTKLMRLLHSAGVNVHPDTGVPPLFAMPRASISV